MMHLYWICDSGCPYRRYQHSPRPNARPQTPSLGHRRSGSLRSSIRVVATTYKQRNPLSPNMLPEQLLRDWTSYNTNLSPPEFITFLGDPPLRVAHHGDQKVEQKDVRDHTEADVNTVHNWMCIESVVHWQVYQTDTQLKLSEDGDRERAVWR